MLFAIIGTDAPDSLGARKRTRADHLKRLDLLAAEGRVTLAGPMPQDAAGQDLAQGFTGSIIVADFESLDAAKVWANADPYVAAGVYESVSVRPFIQVYPAKASTNTTNPSGQNND